MSSNFPSYEEVVALKEDDTIQNIWVYLSEKYGEDRERLRGWFRRETERRRKAEDMALNDETGEELSGTMNDKDFRAETQTSFDDSGNVKSITSKRLIEMDDKQEKDPKFVLTAHGFNPDEWQVVNLINNYWQMVSKAEGKVTLYQSKLTVKPKVENSSITLEDIDNFFETFETNTKAKNVEHKVDFKDGYVLEINLADIHVGNDVVPFDELERRVYNLLEDIKERAKHHPINSIIVAQIGDLFHFDTYHKTTTDGTKIGTKTDFYDMFDVGAQTMIYFLEELCQIANVEVVSVNGNHDRVSGYALMKSLEFYFRDSSAIYFDNTHNERKYRVIGNSLVGWAHGDIPMKNLRSLLQTEARREYGETEYAEMHCGHFHSEMTKDEGSVIVRFVSSITSPDSWHKKEGYLGAKQGTMSFLWSYDKGLVEVWYTGV